MSFAAPGFYLMTLVRGSRTSDMIILSYIYIYIYLLLFFLGGGGGYLFIS